MQIARLEEQLILEQEVADGDQPARKKLAALNNEIAMADFEATQDVHIELNPPETNKHNNAWRTYRASCTRGRRGALHRIRISATKWQTARIPQGRYQPLPKEPTTNSATSRQLQQDLSAQDASI
jgi:hypothetical protein